MTTGCHSRETLITFANITLIVITIGIWRRSHCLPCVTLRSRCIHCCEWFNLAIFRLIAMSFGLSRSITVEPAIDRCIWWNCGNFVELRETQWFKLLQTTLISMFRLLNRCRVLLLVLFHHFLNRKASSDCLSFVGCARHNLRVHQIWIYATYVIRTCEFRRRLKLILLD